MDPQVIVAANCDGITSWHIVSDYPVAAAIATRFLRAWPLAAVAIVQPDKPLVELWDVSDSLPGCACRMQGYRALLALIPDLPRTLLLTPGR